MKYQVYSSYKDSGVEWLGVVPEHWQVLAIKRLTNISRGASPRPIDDPKYFDDDGEYLWTRIADVSASNVYLYDSPQKLSKLGASLSVKLKPESLFLSIAGTVGKVCITARKACIHDGFVYFPNLNQNSKYFFYIFDCGELYKGLGKMNTQLNLNTETVGSIKIALPPIQEQTAIADFLDRETSRIDELSKEKQRFIELLKEKRQALISHAVTKGLNPTVKMKNSGIAWLGEIPEHWKVISLHYLISTIKGYAFKAHDYCDSGVPMVRVSDIKQQSVLLSSIYLPKEFCITHKKVLLNKGDIIISTVGSSPEVVNSAVGQIGQVPEYLDGSLLNQNTVKFQPNNKLQQDYLFFLLLINAYREHLNLHAHGTANQASLNIEDIIRYKIVLPPIKEQTQIANYLDQQTQKIDALITETQNSINLLKEHRAALISAAVTGKIDIYRSNAPALECV